MHACMRLVMLALKKPATSLVLYTCNLHSKNTLFVCYYARRSSTVLLSRPVRTLATYINPYSLYRINTWHTYVCS